MTLARRRATVENMTGIGIEASNVLATRSGQPPASATVFQKW
jgi:hypothetical protein